MDKAPIARADKSTQVYSEELPNLYCMASTCAMHKSKSAWHTRKKLDSDSFNSPTSSNEILPAYILKDDSKKKSPSLNDDSIQTVSQLLFNTNLNDSELFKTHNVEQDLETMAIEQSQESEIHETTIEITKTTDLLTAPILGKETELLEAAKQEEKKKSKTEFRTWKYDRISRPNDDNLTFSSENWDFGSEIPENDDSGSDEPDLFAGPSKWNDEEFFESHENSRLLSFQRGFNLGSRGRGTIGSVASSCRSIDVPASIVPSVFITPNSIVNYLIQRKYYIINELKVFKSQLADESIMVSSLFLFLLYYIFYFILYCGIVHKCIC
ncbi:hypothetical protein HHI36_011632 [Cryptolaemus montrouzieri]|uniref:Uncharacterized protein n=1 Tax=Cryptolaemus montrouzieri TaxID=559131 RepID=A0ABD2MME6_9CUCU